MQSSTAAASRSRASGSAVKAVAVSRSSCLTRHAGWTRAGRNEGRSVGKITKLGGHVPSSCRRLRAAEARTAKSFARRARCSAGGHLAKAGVLVQRPGSVSAGPARVAA